MAEKVFIQTKENAMKIVVDGNEIHGVIAYQLEETTDSLPVLMLKIAITGQVEALR